MGKNPAEKLKAKKAADADKPRKADAADEKKAKGAEGDAHDKKDKPHKPHHPAAKPREEMHCKIKGCKRSYRAKGYCQPHYRKWRHGEYGQARYKLCGDNNCTKPMARNRHGYCEEHFQNYYVKGIEVAKVEAPAAPTKAADAKQAAAS